jgi:ribose/xylose/arabinose/galactoside ABC-type transport system permease subunit
MPDQMKDAPAVAPEPAGTPDAGQPARARVNPVLAWLSPRRIGAVYVWIAIIIVFSIWEPHQFPTWQTVKTILNQNTVSGLVALALVVPLSARVFDLSVGYILGLSTALMAYLLASTSIPLGIAILLTVGAGLAIGILNGTIVVPLRIDSFIGTLASGAVLSAVIILITGDLDISGTRLTTGIAKLSDSVGGIQYPVFILLAIGLILWWLMSHTVTGRRLYATGFNDEAARLTGVPVARLRFGALIVSALVSMLAGIVLVSQIQSASPDLGPPYLLNAYAAAFLGATQIRPGRFNVWGTVIGVFMIATGETGLSQVGAPIWAGDLFTGVVLLLALGMTNLERGTAARRWVANRRERVASGEAAPAAPTSPAGSS